MKPQKSGLKRFPLIVLLAMAFALSGQAQILSNTTKDTAAISKKIVEIPGKTELKPVIGQHDKDDVYTVIDKMPQFPGGESELLKFIGQNLKYPVKAQENGIQGMIIIRFVVNKLGKVEKAEVMRGLVPEINQEGLRVVNALPDWIPGEQNGEKVSVYYTLPINFKLQGESKNKITNEDGSLNTRTPNGEKPLFVIDGKIATEDEFKAVKTDMIEKVTVLKDKSAIAVYGEKGKNGVVIITKKTTEITGKKEFKPAIGLPDKDGVYSVIEKMPLYPGGESELMKFIGQNLRYPVKAQERGIQGRLIIRFVVNKLGKVEKAEVLRGLDQEMDQEGLRVINLLPDWIPGEQKGEKVSVYYTLPITFKLTGSSGSSSKTPSFDPKQMPVFVLDGKVLPKDYNMSTLNKDSILSVIVLKPDTEQKKADLISKYGERAVNGVIEITSKKSE